MPRLAPALFCSLFLFAACATPDDKAAGSGRGGGVALQKTALVYVGSGAFCTRPATIDAAAVAAATTEWQEIQREKVREGSARHSLLKTAMHERILSACRKAAQERGYDLVVRAGDIADPRGLTVADLTTAVVGSL